MTIMHLYARFSHKYNMEKYYLKHAKFLVLLYLSISLIVSFASTTYFSFASPDNKTSMEPNNIKGMVAPNATNIVLVHGAWGDGSVWSKVIPILMNAGHRIIAVQLPLHSLGDDVATVKRAIEQLGGPTILVGHSYGGFVITNAGYNNSNVTGLVYTAAFAPDQDESLMDYVDVSQLPKDYLIVDSGGFLYVNPDILYESLAQDVDPDEADIMAVVQKPINQSILAEKSGSPAWKQLPTWYQVSESDRINPPDAQRRFAERMNATTLSLNASHMSILSHPGEIAELILNATNGSTRNMTR